MTERSGGVSPGFSGCSGNAVPNVGEQTCTAAPLSTIMATVASVLRSVDVIDATKNFSTFTEETACACCSVGGC